MPWSSTNLAGAMGGTVAKAQAAVADLQHTITLYDRQIQANLDKFDFALGAVANSRSLINKLQAAGIYTLILSPGVGSWPSRMQFAPNHPVNSGYSCGFANLILAANPQAALSSLSRLKATFDRKVGETADSIMETIDDISDIFTPEPEPEELDLINTSAFAGKTLDSLFTSDTWHSATLGDVFGGAMQATAEALNATALAGRSLLKQRNMISATSALATKGLSTVNNFLDDLESTGVYSISLAPGAGGYLSRLQSEPGAPPDDPVMYSAGIVCIATAPSVESLLTQYETMTTLLGGY